MVAEPMNIAALIGNKKEMPNTPLPSKKLLTSTRRKDKISRRFTTNALRNTSKNTRNTIKI